MYVSCGEDCYLMNDLGSEVVHELKSTQEEADTRHLFHAASNGYKAIKVVSDDTDLLVLFVAVRNEIRSRIYISHLYKKRYPKQKSKI